MKISGERYMPSPSSPKDDTKFDVDRAADETLALLLSDSDYWSL